MRTASPPAQNGLVCRTELLQSLVDSSAALTVLVAPPGYGKSTLLAQWAEHDDRPFSWLAPARSARLAHEVRLLHKQHGGFVIVVDDAQLAEPSSLSEWVSAALDDLPEGSTIALASRTEPALPLGRLRAHRLLSEIRMPQLAMTCAEAAPLFHDAGIELEPEQLESLVERTEGWPAALYLATLALREDPGGILRVGGDHHLVFEYLQDEVLAPLPADLVTFSIRTSVMAELCGPFCDVVLEQRGSGAVLEDIARANPLLVPVDAAHHLYRWHTLVGEALRSELERIEPELEPVLRLRASRWYAGCGDTRHAIDQAAAAGDAELTGQLLWDNILVYLTSGRNDLVRRWLSNFCDDRIAGCAPLALSASLTAMMAGDVVDAQHWSLSAAASLERNRRGRRKASLATELTVIEATLAEDGLSRMGQAAARAAGLEPQDSLWRPLCLLLEGVAHYLQGDRAAAELELDGSIRLSGNSAPQITSLCLAQRAMVAIEREDWDLATELTDRATMVVEEWGLKGDPLSALTFAAAAASRSRAGRIDEAKRDLRQGIDLLAALGNFVQWYGAEARILLAHASLWLADTVRARTLLAEASRFARRTPDAEIFSGWFDRAWAHLDSLAETSLAGPSSLTIAELRILRFLPSHRSFREIASQLGVSANTVKTQAHAVYRKLGAASRSEAVAQAVDAGLLGY
jgi:LuxR family transcriptional regulator, maltose regulon positive regulatory protein